jgi:hypothetical protein
MRPRTSLGNRAFSKISFAFSPGTCQYIAETAARLCITREHAIDGARLLEQASILGGFGGY